MKSILNYDPETGIFTWINPKNGRPKNKVAGCKNNQGYIFITHNGKKYQAHRLAFLYMEGYLPENFVDHINRIKDDNRWCNLREVSSQCNMQNKRHAHTNKSGVTGVQKSGKYGWAAFIKLPEKLMYLGYSKYLDEAVRMRWEGEKKYNFNGCNFNSEAYLYLKNNNLL